jgi:hypothetical protein
MLRNTIVATALALSVALFPSPASAQQPVLHVNPRWEECSFQLDPALTQTAWRQFAREAGLVVYFRSLTDARPLGKGKFEVSALQWKTGIDDSDPAWNDTFVHPDADHWLFEGSGLEFPGLTVRAGISEKTDVGVYFTRNPGANYGFYGAQVQRNVINNAARGLAASARMSFVSMYGPDDLTFTVVGAEFVGSWQKNITGWLSVSPYAGVSTYMSSAHERSSVVSLDDERVLGAQALVGASMQLSYARIAMEYSIADVPSVSLKVGFGR